MFNSVPWAPSTPERSTGLLYRNLFDIQDLATNVAEIISAPPGIDALKTGNSMTSWVEYNPFEETAH